MVFELCFLFPLPQAAAWGGGVLLRNMVRNKWPLSVTNQLLQVRELATRCNATGFKMDAYPDSKPNYMILMAEVRTAPDGDVEKEEVCCFKWYLLRHNPQMNIRKKPRDSVVLTAAILGGHGNFMHGWLLAVDWVL